MRINVKWIAAFIGLLLGGVSGALLGYFVGWWISAYGQWTSSQHGVQSIFLRSTFLIMGYIAKSDGRVSEQEIAAARHVMGQMRLNVAMRQVAIRCFREGKSERFNCEQALARLRQACYRHPSLLRTFCDIQCYLAYADGRQLSPRKERALAAVCAQLGLSGYHQQAYYHTASGHQQSGYSSRRSQQDALQAAYQALDVDASASDDEVRRAYRRLMSKNHPDKLIAKGLPEEMIALATEKTQNITRAYEVIQQARGKRRR